MNGATTPAGGATSKPGPSRHRRLLLPAALGGLALALSACGTAPDSADSVGGAGDSGRSSDVEASETWTPEPFTPEPSPAPPTPGEPPAPASDPDAAAPSANGPCQPSQLAATSSPVDSATGYRQMSVTVENVSATPCRLSGFPGVDATGLAGTDLTLRRTDGSWSDPADAEPRSFALDPGAYARVLVGWRADPVGTYDEKAGGFQVVLDGTADGPGVGVTLSVQAFPLDIVDGHEVSTSSWAPSTAPVDPAGDPQAGGAP